jgi:hypothetical protein
MLLIMKAIAEELERRLAQLEPGVAAQVERLVRDALALANGSPSVPIGNAWPAGYFARTAGALAGEDFERAQQGLPPQREAW